MLYFQLSGSGGNNLGAPGRQKGCGAHFCYRLYAEYAYTCVCLCVCVCVIVW